MFKNIDWFVFGMTFLSRLCWMFWGTGIIISFFLFQIPIFMHFKKDEEFTFYYFKWYIIQEILMTIPIVCLCAPLSLLLALIFNGKVFFTMITFFTSFAFLEALSGSKIYYYKRFESYLNN